MSCEREPQHRSERTTAAHSCRGTEKQLRCRRASLSARKQQHRRRAACNRDAQLAATAPATRQQACSTTSSRRRKAPTRRLDHPRVLLLRTQVATDSAPWLPTELYLTQVKRGRWGANKEPANPLPPLFAEAAGHACAVCARSALIGASISRCGRCKVVRYCSSQCAKAHWPVHKAVCQELANTAVPACKEDYDIQLAGGFLLLSEAREVHHLPGRVLETEPVQALFWCRLLREVRDDPPQRAVRRLNFRTVLPRSDQRHGRSIVDSLADAVPLH